MLLAGGAQKARELRVPGRELGGVHLAMDYLTQQNRRVAGDAISDASAIWAGGKRVVVIGGGDTGSDCIGTAPSAGRDRGHPVRAAPRAAEGPRRRPRRGRSGR